MSRCRKDDGRFQLQPLGAAGPQAPRQGSPYRQYGPPSVARFHGPTVVGGQTYFRSKAKDKDRDGYIAKDRIKNTNTAEIQGHNSAQKRSFSGRSPKLNNEDSSVVAARELSWADEVDLMLPNSSAQGLNVNSTGDERMKLMNVVEHNAVGMKTTAASNDSNQKIMGESEGKLSKAANAYPPTEHINGKTKQQIERDHDATYGKRVNCPQPRRGSRKKTLSLNPEEREALENLIEEVLMDGAIDSDSASSDDDAERPESWKIASVEGQNGTGCETASAVAGREEDDQKMRNDKGKMGRKYYPGQLKVALKHMTELPPRFSRKLKKAEKYLELNMMRDSITTTGRIEEEDEESVAAAKEEKRSSISPRPPERDREKAKLKEHHAKEFKRSIRTLLRDHNQYAEDCGALNPSSVHPPGAIICEDLERETLNMQGARSAELASYDEVPSNVQNLMLAVEAVSTVDENLSPEDIYLENEVANRNFIGASDSVHHSYANLYAVQDSHGGGQYVMNVPEFVPATMVSAYSPPEALRPDQRQQHVQQYAATLYFDQTLGAVSGSGVDPSSRHGLSSESISMVGQVSPNIVPSSSVPSELMTGNRIEYSAAVPPPSMSLRASLAVPIGEKTMSPMSSAYVPNGAQIHMSTMPSSGALPFYQFQGQSIPPPSVSYGFPIQAPYSSNQYCFMPPSLPQQTLPPAYYPQDQSPYSIDAVHLKPVVNPEWSYLKPKQFAENIPTVSGYSAYPNLSVAPVQYPANDPMASSVSQSSSNFRQRKKQLGGSNVSPRNMGNSSNITSSGKISNQRIRQSENLSGTLRSGHRLGQEVMPSSLLLENGQSASVFGDSSLKRMQQNVRNRGFGDGSSGYPGRRENRNFASEKYSSQRTFVGDGKKEGHHVVLKPKQAKPNQSATRSRNDVTVAQLHHGKPHHASDLSEEGLESPDNFGDIESGADDWSTDNCDQGVSRKKKQGDGSDTNDESKAGSPENEAVTQDAALEISEEIHSPLAKEIPVSDQEDVTDRREPECLAEQVVTANIDKKALEPVAVAGESTIFGLQRLSDVCSAVSKDILHGSEVDRSHLVVENVKKVAEVQARLRLSVCYKDVNLDRVNSLNLQPMDEAVNSPICSVEPEHAGGTFMTKEPSVKVIGRDGARDSETSSIDMELTDDTVGTDQATAINLSGMKLVLGSKFICHLRETFEGCSGTGSSDVCLPMTVCLSHSLLAQLHKEILAQVDLSSSSQSLMGKKSSEEVETQDMLELPCDLHAISATSLTNNMDSDQT